MARVTGPLMSFDASGSVAGSIVFSKWRGRNYVRRHAVPANPRSSSQLAVRSIMGFLASAWKLCDPSNQRTWEVSADALKISAFNRYAGVNASNWRDLSSPAQMFPALKTQTPTAPSTPTASVSGRQVHILSSWESTADDWGIVLCRSMTTGFTATPMNSVAVANVAAYIDGFVDGPIAPGLYYYKLFAFSQDGVRSAASSQVSVTVS